MLVIRNLYNEEYRNVLFLSLCSSHSLAEEFYKEAESRKSRPSSVTENIAGCLALSSFIL